MARKDRTLAGFGEVAANEPKEHVNTNVNKDINTNVNHNNSDNGSVNDHANNGIKNDTNNSANINNDANDEEKDELDKLVESSKNKDNELLLRGIYFDKDIVKVIDKIAKTGGRGMKSKLVNEACRKVFREKGWL